MKLIDNLKARLGKKQEKDLEIIKSSTLKEGQIVMIVMSNEQFIAVKNAMMETGGVTPEVGVDEATKTITLHFKPSKPDNSMYR